MNFCLLLLASLTSVTHTASLPSIQSNATLPSSSLGIAYRCASSTQRDVGFLMPSALNCLNVLTYILATTPNHDQPTIWSSDPGPYQTTLPYRRTSGNCQLYVRLTARSEPRPHTEIASFDQVVGASMRIIEVCLLNGRTDVGGVALVGMGANLDVVVWGSPVTRGDEEVPSNRTVALIGSGDRISQS